MPPSSEDPENVSRKIHCFSRKWGDLPDNDAPDSLVKDLLDSLAELNIPELKLRKYRDMNLTNLDTESAASMFKLLETVAKDLKIFGTAGRINWGVGDERDDAYFGIWVPRLAYEHCAWANFFPDKNAIIGWFGYEGKRNGRVEALTVSFPFGGDGDSAKLKEFLEGKLQLTVESKSDYFFVQKPPNEKESDADWLVSVLKSLRDATKPKGRPT